MKQAEDLTSAILAHHLDSDFWSASGPAHSLRSESVLQFGADVGCSFPPEFIAHATGERPGVYVEVKEEHWPRPKAGDVGPFWSFLYGLFVFSFDSDAPDWMQVGPATQEFRADTDHPLVPCLKVVGDADLFLITSEGRIVQWWHETDELEPFDGHFFDLLDLQVRELRERKDQKVADARPT